MKLRHCAGVFNVWSEKLRRCWFLTHVTKIDYYLKSGVESIEGLDMTRLIIILCGMFFTSSAAAHPYDGPPYDAPRTFILHVTDDGRPIFTNIPKKCFSEGRLTCIQLHPIFKGSSTIEKPEN